MGFINQEQRLWTGLARLFLGFFMKFRGWHSSRSPFNCQPFFNHIGNWKRHEIELFWMWHVISLNLRLNGIKVSIEWLECNAFIQWNVAPDRCSMNPAAFSSLPTNAANATRQTQLNHSKPCVGANFHFWSVVGRKRHCDRVFFWSVCFFIVFY